MALKEKIKLFSIHQLCWQPVQFISTRVTNKNKIHLQRNTNFIFHAYLFSLNLTNQYTKQKIEYDLVIYIWLLFFFRFLCIEKKINLKIV